MLVKPFSRTLKLLIQTIQAEERAKITTALQAEFEELELPQGTNADLGKGCWILAPIKNPEDNSVLALEKEN
jgi:hypothetical protein